jgi:hypothetical protein
MKPVLVALPSIITDESGTGNPQGAKTVGSSLVVHAIANVFTAEDQLFCFGSRI